MSKVKKLVELTDENYETHQCCMNCASATPKQDLVWIKDNYGIPFKKVCSDCYEEVEAEIRSNHYGYELSSYELYGEE